MMSQNHSAKLAKPFCEACETILRSLRSRMVGQVGIEPTANWLRANCSTTELLTQVIYLRELGNITKIN